MEVIEEDPFHGKPLKERLALRKQARELDPTIKKIEGRSHNLGFILFPVFFVILNSRLAPRDPVFAFVLSFYASLVVVIVAGAVFVTPKIRRALNSDKAKNTVDPI
jgi:hypothetical protein